MGGDDVGSRKLHCYPLNYIPGLEHELSYSFAILLRRYLGFLVMVMRMSTLSCCLSLSPPAQVSLWCQMLW